MFVLNIEQFGEFDLKQARQFIDFWKRKYPDTQIKVFKSKEPIDYLIELNLENKLNPLTEDNIKRLLRWKDPYRLTEKISSDPNRVKKNEKVTKVLEKLQDINVFRFGKMTEKDFEGKTKDIFPTGIIWRIFLFHIARPFEYPLADKNVFLAFKTHKKVNEPKDFKGYKLYKDYFFEISKYAGVIIEEPTGDEKDIRKIVKDLKEVDDALFAFGKFLELYEAVQQLPNNQQIIFPAQI